jgi:quinol monooxygenase YgiN
MIIVAGTLFVDPHLRGEYLTATYAVAVQARAAPGCLDFVQAADPVDPARINIYERWETDDDVEAFRNSGAAPDNGLPAVRLPEIRSADVHRFRISSVEAA